MKRGMIFVLLYLFCILQVSVITADIITIGQSGGGEISIGSTPVASSLTGIPAPTPAPTPSGGPGGGPSAEAKIFSLDKTFLPVEVKKGEHYQEQITITNEKTTAITINVSVTDIGRFLFPEEESFVLGGGESRIINFDIYFSENEKTDVYIGKIIFSSGSTSKFVNVVLDVKEKAPLFDIKTTVTKKRVSPGKKVTAKVEILNLGDLKKIDVELEYSIRDFNNKSYTSKKESFAVEDSLTKKIFLEVPEELETGKYIFYSKINYNNISAASYDTFTVVEISAIEILTSPLFLIIISLLIIIILFLIIMILKKRKKIKEKKETFGKIEREPVIKKEIKPEEKIAEKKITAKKPKVKKRKPAQKHLKSLEKQEKLRKQMFKKLLRETVKAKRK